MEDVTTAIISVTEDVEEIASATVAAAVEVEEQLIEEIINMRL